MVVAAPPAVHPDLHALLVDLDADRGPSGDGEGAS
jgi:hypothetical protein